MLVVFCCAAGWLLFQMLAPQTLGEQARRIFEQQLADHYADWRVSIGRGTFQPGVGLTFESIRLTPRDESGGGIVPVSWWSQSRTVTINRLTLLADLDLGQWLADKSPIVSKRVIVEGVTATMHVDADGRHSLSTLWPPPKLGPICPRIELHDATVRIDCPAVQSSDGEGTGPNDGRPVELHLTQVGILSLNCHDDGDRSAPMSRRILAKGSSSFSGPIELEIDQRFAAAGAPPKLDVRWSCQQFQADDQLLRRLTPLMGFDVCGCESLSGVRWRVMGDASGAFHDRDDFVVQATIHDGGWIDPRLPSQIDQWRGRLEWTPTQVRLLPTQARLGDAVCRLSGRLGLTIDDPGISGASDSLANRIRIGAAEMHLSAEGLSVDPSIASVLPTKTAAMWNRFEPKGRMSADLHFANQVATDPKTWTVRGGVDLQGIDIRFDKFPYPVQQMIGEIKIDGGEVFSPMLTGRAGGRRLHCEFRVPLPPTLCGGKSTLASGNKSVIIRSEGSVPMDDALITALTPRDETGQTGERSGLESFVRSLHPSGEIELAEASVMIDPTGRLSRQFDLRILGGSLRYDHFPYPLYNVAGRIQIQDDLVRVIGFTANNAGSAKVLCDGLVRLGDEAELNLRFRAAEVAMDHSLRTSLPEPSRNLWDGLAPSGILDRLDVHLHRVGKEPLGLTLAANQHESNGVQTDSLSIRPTALPYRLDVVDGTIRYDGRRVEIENLGARHGNSRMFANGTCVPIDDRHWKLSLNLLSGCRLTLDEELASTLPPQVAFATRQLDLRGPVQLRGTTNVVISEVAEELPTVDWNLLLQLEGNRIGDVGPVHSIRGEVQVSGISNAEIVRAGGTVAIDSMHAMGLQITSIRGPFSIAGNDLRLGALSSGLDPISAATNPEGVSDRRAPIVGNLFGGMLDLSGAVSLASGDFDVGWSVVGGELATLLAEMGQSRNDMRGRFDLNVRMDGRLGDTDLLKGNGRARLSGANLYQLPVIVQTLNLLRITPTEDVAFTDGDSEFAFFGEDVNFTKLTLWGDLVALEGGGTLTRRDQLDLSFNTRVSPQNLFSKVINPLRDDRYTFWTIEVDGPIDGPTIRRRSLSGIAQTMEEIFPGTVRSSTVR